MLLYIMYHFPRDYNINFKFLIKSAKFYIMYNFPRDNNEKLADFIVELKLLIVAVVLVTSFHWKQ